MAQYSHGAHEPATRRQQCRLNHGLHPFSLCKPAHYFFYLYGLCHSYYTRSMTIRHFEQHQPQLGADVYIDEAATVIGRASLGERVSVWPNAVIRGDVNWIEIGADSNVQDGAVLHVSHEGPFKPEGAPLKIGQRVTVGHLAMLHGCTIGDDCLIGMNATVMDDVVIEAGTMVAAGALVTPGKLLKSGWLYAGSPAKAVRKLKDSERQFITYSAEHYAKLAQRHTT